MANISFAKELLSMKGVTAGVSKWENVVELFSHRVDATRQNKDNQARDKAEKLGIEWERPAGNNDSARHILDENPLLKNLGNQEGIKDKLKERVGDYEKDADAAYRAVQVLKHIEKFDSNGNRIASKDVNNGTIDGITNGNRHVTHGSESGRLLDFGKYGFDSLKGNLKDADKAWMDPTAREQAEALGIQWERQKGDDRSAREIIENTPVLRNLGNQSGVKDMLKERVGDFENDADAAHRAAQVLEHIERFNIDGKNLEGNKVGDGIVDGFTKSGEAKNGTEAGRLQDFGKYGFGHLKGKLPDRGNAHNNDAAREKAKELGIKWVRNSDDKRSAAEIIEQDPLLKNLGNQSGVKDKLKDQVGDFEKDADAAYRASQVLEHIERYNGRGEAIVGKDVDNGIIDGFTSSNEARHGSEAGRLQDFGKNGFDSLKGDLGKLPEKTNQENARKQAEALGIKWERPKGDDRTARDILGDVPLLRNLGNQSGVKDMLKERVGDFEKDADAAYRAAQVLTLIEQSSKPAHERFKEGNGVIDGFTKSGEAKHDSEAGLLQDFGKYGFSHLKGKLENRASIEKRDKVNILVETVAKNQAAMLGFKWERPEGDSRSAFDILDQNPLLKNLGNQEEVRDMLKKRVGDFEHDADAAYRAVQVLEHIEMFDAEGKTINDKNVGNSIIDGFTSHHQAKHGTEAGRLKDFGEQGFSVLKGKFPDRSDVGNNKEARKQAEALGIDWELDKSDKRSASEIINDSPLLKNLGNQSGVRELLKDRVGDFDKDANAAYRAKQVLEQIERFDEKGRVLSGDNVNNGIIDGFTKSGEARNGTEAGRLQDFGKYGFSSLKNSNGSGSKFNDYKKANPDADETSRTIAEYASILHDNFDTIINATGGGDFLTVDKIQKFKDEYKGLDKKFSEAIDFWSNPGSFSMIETSVDKLRYGSDGLLSKSDITNWIDKEAPKDAQSVIEMFMSVAQTSTVSDMRVEEFGSSEIFTNPGRYSLKEKAAVLNDLQTAHDLVAIGEQSGMWKKLPQLEKKLAEKAGITGTPTEIMDNIQKKIDLLREDPEVVKFMEEEAQKVLSDFVNSNSSIKASLQKTYDEDITTGKLLDETWSDKSSSTKTSSLGSFFQTARFYQAALGLDDTKAIQDAVKNSKYNVELEKFYENSLVTGDRFKELLKEHSVEEAIATVSMEVALYNASLDPKFTGKFDNKLEENFTNIAKENLFKDASFEDIKKVFAGEDGVSLDEDKLLNLIEEIGKTNPALLTNSNGVPISSDLVLMHFRAEWDLLRQGTKSLDKMGNLDNDSSAKSVNDKGVLHVVSGLMLAGVTIAKGVNSKGSLTERQKVDLATGSIMTVTLLTEGGAKGLKNKIEKIGGNPKVIENTAKTVGGLAGIAVGAYSIFDGVQSIRKGDKAGGGLNIAAGSLGVLAGVASTVEGGMGLLGMTIPRLIPVLAGGLGFAAAALGAVSIFVMIGLRETDMSNRENDFVNLLDSHLGKFDINWTADKEV